MTAIGVVSALWRSSPRRDRREVEIVGQQDDGQLVLREVGRFYRGVWIAPRDQVRLAGPIFTPRAAR